MVNADKHRALKVLNELTARERLIRQVKNKKKNYDKTKFKVNGKSKRDVKTSSKLEALSYKV